MVEEIPLSGGASSSEVPRGRLRRRDLLLGGLAAAGGAATVAVGGGIAAQARQEQAVAAVRQQAQFAQRTTAFHGQHQPGVVTAAPAHTALCAFDLRKETDVDGFRKLLRLLTDDIARMMSGRPALGDTAPDLAVSPAALEVTVGFGHSLFDRINRAEARPAGLTEMPPFPAIDQLTDDWNDGDLLLQISADDPTTVAHSQRMLLKDTRAFATTRWVQRGFLNARGSRPPGTTPRNLMGQLDGTVNPTTATEHNDLVWHAGNDWFDGGTTMVVRRIRMDMNSWDELDRSAMETAIGRRLSNGAPLTGTNEHDEPDLTALDDTGLKAIADFAHIRLARGGGPKHQILRRPYNYDNTPGEDGDSDLGQIFCSYQKSIAEQFVPMQRRLADGDLFNRWITPVGSAVFAIPPGCQPGGFIGEGLYT